MFACFGCFDIFDIFDEIVDFVFDGTRFSRETKTGLSLLVWPVCQFATLTRLAV